MDATNSVLSIIGGIIVILGFLGAVIGYLMKLAAQIAVLKKTLETACDDVVAAHDKLRRIDPIIADHTTAIAVMKNDITYIRAGIDDIRDSLRAARS